MTGLTFLEAEAPLTKTFSKDGDEYLKSAYPRAFLFTSHEESVETLEQMEDALKNHASVGHCLLKGNVTSPLESESRAGSTVAEEPTDWICLDVDGVAGFATAAEFIKGVLPAEFQDVSYIEQHSCSAGIGNDELRMHVFMKLETPAYPSMLKSMLKRINLDRLTTSAKLSSNGRAIRWGLDVTVCQNDKLLYIAPPQCLGFDDPIAERIHSVTESRSTVSLGHQALSIEDIEKRERDLLNKLRSDAGLPAREFKVSKSGLQLHPEQGKLEIVSITGGFVHINLDGGDSAAYYHAEDNPVVIYNFKGEAPFKADDVQPGYAAWYRNEYLTLKNDKSDAQWFPIAFRDMSSDMYFAVLWNRDDDAIKDLHRCGSKDKVEDYLSQHMAPMPDPVPTWEMEFDPQRLTQIDLPNCWMNTWRPTTHLLGEGTQTEMPVNIEKIIRHVLVDDESYHAFMNWLAVIFQTRKKTGVAWLLHGCPGTGKGIMFSVLRELFGPDYTPQIGMDEITGVFNKRMGSAIICNLDEASSLSNDDGKLLANKMKSWITEPTVSVRAMQTDWREIRSFGNFIITSNDFAAVTIPEHDRRWNVAPRQAEPLIGTVYPDIIPGILGFLHDEIGQFADYLRAYPADEKAASTPLVNEAKEIAMLDSMDSIGHFVHALETADLTYFVEGMESGYTGAEAWSGAKIIVAGWQDDFRHDRGSHVRGHDVLTVYNALLGGKFAISAKRFHKLCAHRQLEIGHRFRDEDGNQYRGLQIVWSVLDEDLELWENPLKVVTLEDKIKQELDRGQDNE